jgi:hypothetical protein
VPLLAPKVATDASATRNRKIAVFISGSTLESWLLTGPERSKHLSERYGDVTPVIAPCETNGQVLMPHRRMQGKMTAYGKRQFAAEGLRPLGLRCQRHLHLQ